MALEKLLIARERGGKASDEPADQVRALFNPEEYTINQDNNFASQAVPGLKSTLLQFVHGNMRTLEMELFLDTYEESGPQRDVRTRSNQSSASRAAGKRNCCRNSRRRPERRLTGWKASGSAAG